MGAYENPADLVKNPWPGVSAFGALWKSVRASESFNKPIQSNVYVSFGFQEGLLPAIDDVRAEIREVRASLAKQQATLEEILLAVRGATAELIEIDEVTEAEARERVLALFRESSGSLFYDDIAERLRLPLRQTVEICNQLEMEGLIGQPATK